MLTIDDREITQHPDIPDKLGLSYQVERLGEADYAFLDRDSEPEGIERAEINNLMQKLRSGELEDQLSRCAKSYSKVILLVEGVYDSIGGYLAVYRQTSNGYYRVRTYPTTRYDSVIALLSRFQELGLEVLHTPGFEQSMEAIRALYKQRTKPEESHTMFKRIRTPHLPTKTTSNPAVPRLMALCPRLGEKPAIRLVYKYGSIWNILQASDEELLEVEGFGKGLLKNLKEGIGR